MALLFWSCLVLVIYVYMGYPLLIGLLSLKKKPISNQGDVTPVVSILIAAYNEEEDIGATLRNKIELDYPRDRLEIIVVSDESTDRTDEIVSNMAAGSDVPIRLVRQSPRQGKTSGLNLIVPQAKGDVIVFSDANSLYDSRALKSLVRNFADPDVGYVTGKMIYTNPDGSLVGDGCSSYMKYENWIRDRESRTGSIVGVDGGVDAMRTALYEQLRADQLPDFVQPLKIVEKGYRVIYEPDALLKEEALNAVGREYTMRVRVTLRALWALYDMRSLLNPFKFGLFSLQLLSHKLLRYLAFVPLLVVFLLNPFLAGSSGIYLAVLLCQMLFYSLAWIGCLHQHRDNNPVYYALPYYFVLLNIASLHAVWRFLRGEKQVVWKPRVG